MQENFYVSSLRNQKEHHAQDRTIAVLERLDDLGVQMVREPAAVYAADDADWWREMEEMAT